MKTPTLENLPWSAGHREYRPERRDPAESPAEGTYPGEPTLENLPYRTYPTEPTLQNLPYRTYPTEPTLQNLPCTGEPTLEPAERIGLPCTYPAAAGSLQGRLPLWTLPDFPSGSPSRLPSSPARLRAPGSLPNPRPPPTLQPPTDPRPAARRPPDRVGAVGRQDWARGRILIFRNIRLYGKSAKSTHGKRPTLYLP
jgi:hypothetical protein